MRRGKLANPAAVLGDSQALAEQVAATLVATGAVSFRTKPPFRFTSGVSSPVYVDNRQLLGHVDERSSIVDGFHAAITSAANLRSIGAVAGTATAGIPWAAWIADRLDLPMLYVRAKAKDWGQGKAVEGTAPASSDVLLIEDLSFTAGSLATAAERLREADFRVAGAMTIVSYETASAHERLQAASLPAATLTTIDAALESAERMGRLAADETAAVRKWLGDLR
ncbi:MAG: orotate phosphoribosyltransferase [Thermoleophilaceae bacterium]|jgi:orotate phosphoribosyltransferase|nr:orotate phosphoribosyltransferase [Thermoleophilaceae bacterium]